MSEPTNPPPQELQPSKREAAIEIVGGVFKGLVSQIPIAGPILAEILGIVIPNRRMERILTTLTLFGQKLEEMDSTVRDTQMQTETFTDLLEEGMWQAARAITDERKEAIAALLANSLKDNELSDLQKKRLLLLLSEVNDAEIVILKYYSLSNSPTEQRKFFEFHHDLLTMPVVTADSDIETIDQSTMLRNYRNNLLRLNLISLKFKKPKKGELPKFDLSTGMIETSGVSITALGKLLLRYIDA